MTSGFTAYVPTPTGLRGALWPMLLVVATMLYSLHFVCAVPFAALAAVTALTMRPRAAVPMMIILWLGNQLIGFLVLGYPRTLECFSWGAAFGGAVLLAALAAQLVRWRLASAMKRLRPVLALTAALISFELSLLLLSILVFGEGVKGFAPGIIADVVGINAVACVELLALHHMGASYGLFVARPFRNVVSPVRQPKTSGSPA